MLEYIVSVCVFRTVLGLVRYRIARVRSNGRGALELTRP